jgi:hypothetical protein
MGGYSRVVGSRPAWASYIKALSQKTKNKKGTKEEK